MRLKGKTQKGRNVIQRDGAEWIEIRRSDSVACFDGRPGIFVMPANAGEQTTTARWIEPTNDQHFEVTE